MTIVQAILMAIIEGVTEFLPISSTGHMILLAKLLGLAQTEFVKTFEVVIQLGAILAVVFLYGKKLLVNKKTLMHVFAAFLPTALFGFLLYPLIKRVLLDNTGIVIAALFLGGITMIILERIYKTKTHSATLTLTRAVIIGIIQCLSFVPGVSRAAATIFGGLFLGLTRREAVEFSFLLAIPTMAAATGLDLVKNVNNFHSSELGLIAIGLVGSFITATVVVKWLVKYVQTNTFVPFGIYRIIISLLFLFI